MSEKDKNNSLYIYDEVQHDEMQKAISFEMEHKCLRMWYLLNNIWTLWAAFMVFIDVLAFWAPIIILGYYVIMLFCQVVYDIRASAKGVLDSLSQYQTGMKGWRYIIAIFQIMIPANAIGSYTAGGYGYEERAMHPVFFIVFLVLSFAYDVISVICVSRNKKVMDNSADEDETDE